MEYVAHETDLDRPVKDGSTRRATFEASAENGNTFAQEKLASTPFPESLDYLYAWFTELSAARGEGMTGAAPLTHQGIAAWARLTDQHPEPHEVRALLTIDSAFRAALRDEPVKPTADTPEPVAPPSWPSPKVN